jgi:hypothetical protein
VWLWRIDDDEEILLAKAPGKTSLWALQLPASDPNSDLFQGIQEWVHNARQLALETEQVRISQPRTFPKKKSKKSSNEP